MKAIDCDFLSTVWLLTFQFGAYPTFITWSTPCALNFICSDVHLSCFKEEKKKAKKVVTFLWISSQSLVAWCHNTVRWLKSALDVAGALPTSTGGISEVSAQSPEDTAPHLPTPTRSLFTLLLSGKDVQQYLLSRCGSSSSSSSTSTLHLKYFTLVKTWLYLHCRSSTDFWCFCRVGWRSHTGGLIIKIQSYTITRKRQKKRKNRLEWLLCNDELSSVIMTFSVFDLVKIYCMAIS